MGRQRAVFEKMYGRVQEEMNKLEGCYEAGVKCYEENERVIEKCFGEIRRLVDGEEELLKQKLKDLFVNF